MAPQPPAQASLHGHCLISGRVMFNAPPNYSGNGSQTSRVRGSPYQTQYFNRTSAQSSTGRSTRSAPHSARRPVPPSKQVLNRATTPRYVLRSIAGYGGHIPNRRFLRGGVTHQGEIEVLDYEGMVYQPLRPTQVPQKGNGERFLKDTICPGYAGHVPQMIYNVGNFRVPGFKQQYKGEIQARPFHNCPTYTMQ